MADVQTIQKLRTQTGAGMVDCKNALDEAQNDYDKAIEILRKKGEATAAKKSERATNEGLISIARTDDKLAVVGLLCETDFVARNEDFQQAVKEYAAKLLELNNVEEFSAWANEQIKKELVVKIGENIQLGPVKLYQGEGFGSYLHSNKKVASVVKFNKKNEEVATEVAMQVVAMSPEYLKPEDVPTEVLEKEKEIYTELLRKEGKSQEIIEKILVGKVNKFYDESCLTKQAFIKEDSMSVEKYLNSKDGLVLESFERITL